MMESGQSVSVDAHPVSRRISPLMLVIGGAIVLRLAVFAAALSSNSDWSRAAAPSVDELSDWWSHLSAHAGNAIASLQLLIVVPWIILLATLVFRPGSDRLVRRVFVVSVVAFVALWLFVAVGVVVDGSSDPSLEWG